MLKKKGVVIFGLMFFVIFILAYNTSAETINYARNPSFEEIDGFGRPGSWVYVGIPWVDYFPDENQKVLGERSLKIVLGRGDSIYARDAGVWITPLWGTVPVQPNTTYTLSYYIKAEDPSSVYAYPYIRGLDINKRWDKTYYTFKSLESGWQRVIHTFTPHDHVYYLQIGAWVTKRYAPIIQDEQTVWMDGVQFEEGSVATDFVLPKCVSEKEGITHGRFANFLFGEDVDKPLRKLDGSIIQPTEVFDLYGTEDGMAIYDEGIDVTSYEFQAKMGYPHPLKPAYQDLSDEAGWPDIYVKPDTVGIDPLLGRFAFFSGGCANPDGAVLKSKVWTGFGVPGGDIEARGDYAYIPPIEGNFQVLDIRDKTKPKVVGHFPIGGSDVTVIGNYAYLAHQNGVWALDISNPADPKWPGGITVGEKLWQVAEGEEGARLKEIASKNSLLYVTVANRDTCLYILDASEPLNIVEMGSLTIDNSNGALQLFVHDDNAYLGMYNEGLYEGGVAIVDITNPANPQKLSHYVPSEAGSISPYEVPLIGIAPPYLIMSKKRENPAPAELIIVDASDPSQPFRKGAFQFEAGVEVVLKRAIAERSQAGSLIYVTDCNRDTVQIGQDRKTPPTRLLTFDISSPENPTLVDEYLQQGTGKYRYLFQEESYLYLTDANFGVRIFDISNPSSPYQIGKTPTAAENHFAVLSEDGRYAYVNQTFGGTVRVIDISDPGFPSEVGSYWDGEWDTKMQPKSKGNYLYLPHRYGVKIIDVSDPTNPVKVDEFGPMLESYSEPDISLFGDNAYISVGHKQGSDYQKLVYSYNLSNPTNSTPISSILLTTSSNMPLSPYLFAQGDYLYTMLHREKQFLILDVSDHTSPQIIGSLQDDSLEKGHKLYVSRGYAYICIFEMGTGNLLHIVDVRDPSNPVYVKRFEFPGTDSPPFYLGYLGAEDIRIAGRYMYIGSYSNVLIFDISDPINPEYVGDTDTYGFRRQGWHSWTSWGAGWSSGELLGRYLYSPSLDHLNVIEIIRDSQAPFAVTVSANLFVDTIAPIVSNIEIIPNPAAVDTSLILRANIDDSMTFGSPIESAEFRIDGGAFVPMTAEDGEFDAEIENVQANIDSFQVAGVYNICVSGIDSYGNASQGECALLAVYDPEGGFVTGGGWINSPLGAYVADPTLTGKANFGFVSKYKKGASIPIGQTEFQFKAADLNFHSNSYDWLVIAGSKAMYKGVGKINGEGNYGFMLSAIDEALTPSTDVDLFRIKIWDKDAGDATAYDNQIGEAEDADPITAIGGGNIKIHKGQ